MTKKRFNKFLCLLLVLVLCLSIFIGCGTDIFSVNEDRYREQVVLTVGSVEVTMGQIIDWFNVNASNYISQGYDVQTIWDSLYPQFVQQRIFMNELILSNPTKNTSALAAKYKYGEYMYYNSANDPFDATVAGFTTQESYRNKMLVYIIKSVYVSLLEALDKATENKLVSYGFKFNEAEEDATRDSMISIPDEKSASVWETDFDIRSSLKDLDRKLKKYPSQNFDAHTLNYVFSINDSQLQDAVDKLNDRINKEDDDTKPDVTKEDYIKAQKAALRTTTRNIKTNNNKSIEGYIKKAIEDQITSQMAIEAQKPFYKGAEGAISRDDFNNRLRSFKEQFEQNYTISRTAFESFITNLSSSSFVYSVPAEYQGEYHYVLNLVIPFSDEQTAALTEVAADVGSNSASYQAFRYSLANKIVVKEYYENYPEGVAPGEPGNKDGKVVSDFVNINPSAGTISVNTNINSLTADGFREKIYLYGTDPGSINPAYGYVTGVNPFDLADSGNEKFMKEFADAARELAKVNSSSIKTTACVTDYGIHIMYYAGEVKADVHELSAAEWDSKLQLHYGIEGGSAIYRFFKAYYDEIKSDIVSEKTEQVVNLYKEGFDNARKIIVNEGEMTKYLKNYDAVFENTFKF